MSWRLQTSAKVFGEGGVDEERTMLMICYDYRMSVWLCLLSFQSF